MTLGPTTRILMAALAAPALAWTQPAPSAAQTPTPMASAHGTAAAAAGAPGAMFKVMDLSAYKPFEVAAGAPGTHPLAVAPPGDTTLAPEALAKAQAYSDKMGGYALLVWQGGAVRYEHYTGGADADTRFETFSMHKSVLALVYGAALRDRVIGSLDDKVGDYLAEWRGDARGAITLRQLLSMESGLSRGQMDDQASVALVQTPEVPPGTRFEYNNVNPEIAGVVLDRALRRSGRGDYASYLSEALLKPVGAGDAHLWIDHPGGLPRFYAFCEMGARDWLRLGMLIDRKGVFDGRAVLPEAWIRAETTPSALNPNYGLLTWIGSPWAPQRAYSFRVPLKAAQSAPFLAPDLVFFDGSGGQRVYVAPSLDLVIVRIGEPTMAFDDSAIPNAVISGLTPAAPR